MRLDHVSFAVGPDGLSGTVDRLTELLSAKFVDAGVHPRFGTRTMVLPMVHNQYLEVVESLDHPAAEKAEFGQVVRERSATGGGWLGWSVAVDEIEPAEHRIGRHAVPANRRRPDGFNLRWRQIGVRGQRIDPQLPFVVCWEVPYQEHPSQSAPAVTRLSALEIGGSVDRLADWLGEPVPETLGDIALDWVAPYGPPGIVAVRFDTPAGEVRL